MCQVKTDGATPWGMCVKWKQTTQTRAQLKHEKCVSSENGRRKHKRNPVRDVRQVKTDDANASAIKAREMCVKWKRTTQTQAQPREGCASSENRRRKRERNWSTRNVRQVKTDDANTSATPWGMCVKWKQTTQTRAQLKHEKCVSIENRRRKRERN